MVVNHIDAQTFSLAPVDMHGVELAALYTLQHSLARDAENFRRLLHWDIALGGVLDEAPEELIGDADLPWRAWGQLFPGNEPVVEPTVDGRGRDAENFGGLFDGDQFPLSGLIRGFAARDVPMPPQIAYAVGREAVTVGGALTLAVEDSGNHGIRVVGGQAPHKLDGVLIRAYRGGARAWAVDVELGEHTAVPAKREVGAMILPMVGDDDFLEQRPQQFFSVTRRGRGSLPDAREVFTETE